MSDLHKSQSDLPDARLEAYLDGLMTPAEQQAFESESAGNEQLRCACELQKRVDASLGRIFVVPAPRIDVLALVDRESPTGKLNQLPNRDQNTLKKRRRT